jgi:hypothetical protein
VWKTKCEDEIRGVYTKRKSTGMCGPPLLDRIRVAFIQKEKVL